MVKKILFFVAICSTLSCTYYDHGFSYDFDNPIKIFELREKLEEISGLVYKNENKLYAIQDEKGDIFEINLTSGEERKVLDFKKEGDFEGLTTFEDFFYVLKSDGDIYKVDLSGKDEKYTFFDDDDDFEFEGLCVYPEKKILLVACKKHGKKDKDNSIWIYSFSLEENRYLKEPFLVIEKDKIHEKFRASGISFNEKGNLYLISAITFTIAEFNLKGELQNKAQLPFTPYPQVEGICFDKKGTLFLATEKGNQSSAQLIILQKNEK